MPKNYMESPITPEAHRQIVRRVEELEQIVGQLESLFEKAYWDRAIYELSKPTVADACFRAVMQVYGVSLYELTRDSRKKKRTKAEERREFNADTARFWLLTLLRQLVWTSRPEIKLVLKWANQLHHEHSRDLMEELQRDYNHADRRTWRELLNLVRQKCDEIGADPSVVIEELQFVK